VVHPEDGNIGLHLGDKVQDHRFVGAEIGGDDGAALRVREGPFHDFERRMAF